MVNVTEIRELKAHLEEFYANLKKEQRADIEYYNDTFAVPQIDNTAIHKSRTGEGARMVDSPVEHIITTHPQASRFSKSGDKNEEKNERILRMVNQNWMPVLKNQNPNPFKESTRNAMKMGESWLYIVHNESWVTGNKERTGLPVKFLTPEPMSIYADPDEYNGVPKRLVIWASRLPWLVARTYPGWGNPKNRKASDEVEWLAYWDKDYRYFEADGEPVLMDGIQPNIFGFVPYVHAVSGFGSLSEDGDPASLIIGRLRKSRDKLVRDCAISSTIDAIIYLMGQPQTDFRITDKNVLPSPTMIQDYEIGLGRGNIVPSYLEVLPKNNAVIPDWMFQHQMNIKGDLREETPPVLQGLPSGYSGRQQDMAGSSAMQRYMTVVENIENQFSTGFSMALKLINGKVPGLMEAVQETYNIKKGDIGSDYNISIKLRAPDELADMQKSTQGSRDFQGGEIDLLTNLVRYKGYTFDEAKEIIVRRMVDDVTFLDPTFRQVVGIKSAERFGLEDEIQKVQEMNAGMADQQAGLQSIPSPSVKQRRMGETATPLGREMVDESLRGKAGRRSPRSYFRGGE